MNEKSRRKKIVQIIVVSLDGLVCFLAFVCVGCKFISTLIERKKTFCVMCRRYIFRLQFSEMFIAVMAVVVDYEQQLLY